MQVPEEARKCVVFIGFRNADGMYEVRGTAFFVSRAVEGLNRSFGYVITAKHVIDKIRDKSIYKVSLRLNFKDGNARWVETDISDWYFHPSDSEVDVALLRWSFPTDCDHHYLPTDTFATESFVKNLEISNGDEVCITGLFARHYGTKKNIPIVRIGNIAAMPEERIETSIGLIDAYLIEARSIGGLSGSPVLVNLGLHRYLKGQFVQALEGPIFFLLGLVHGHWDALPSEMDMITEDAVSAEKVNMGIAIVVPATKILEVINQPMVRKKDKEEEQEIRRQRLPTLDAPNTQ